MKRWLLIGLLVLSCSAVQAQQAFVVEVSPGNYAGIFLAADGTVHAIARLTIVKPNPTIPPVTTATRATYVFEKDDNNVPRPVALALQKLNLGGVVVASEFEQNTVNGLGEVPAQYKVALDAAKKVGLPALVVEDSAGRVLRVVKAPVTAKAVEDSVK